MQARSQHGFWVPDMSVKCFVGWHLKFSAGGYAHHSQLSTACTNAYRKHSFARSMHLRGKKSESVSMTILTACAI